MALKQSLFQEGEPPRPDARFNAAEYCLSGSGAPRTKAALVLVSAIDTPPQIWRYGEVSDAVRRIAAGLKAYGLRPGDRVMLRLGHEPEFPLFFFGALAAGGIALPTSSQLSPQETAYIAEDAAPRFFVGASATAFDGIPETAATARLGGAAIADLLAFPKHADFEDTAGEDPAYLVYTSGSGGRPKGVLHAHRAVYARRMMWDGWYGLRADDRVLHAGAFNWTYTLGAGLMDPWAIGATTIIYDGPRDPTIWGRIAQAHSATIFAAVPGVYRQVLKYDDTARVAFQELRHGLTAGEKLSQTVREDWETTTGKPLFEALGMSECSTYVSSSPKAPVKHGASGRPQRGRRVAILPVDGDDTPLPIGGLGVLSVHKDDPGLMLGYWGSAARSEASFRGDWFLTGDLATMDEDGYVAYQGRADDLMNAMGYRVSPQEVEDVLNQHPSVIECAAAELRVKEDVSVVAAFVVLQSEASSDALKTFCAERLAAYKTPKEILIVDSLPRSANGKLRRRDLAAKHAKV
ncbi:MAG: acyl-CoA synthetase [Pseudomonadota bacterium]